MKRELHYSHLTRWGPEVWTETTPLTEAESRKTRAIQAEIQTRESQFSFLQAIFSKGPYKETKIFQNLVVPKYTPYRHN